MVRFLKAHKPNYENKCSGAQARLRPPASPHLPFLPLWCWTLSLSVPLLVMLIELSLPLGLSLSLSLTHTHRGREQRARDAGTLGDTSLHPRRRSTPVSPSTLGSLSTQPAARVRDEDHLSLISNTNWEAKQTRRGAPQPHPHAALACASVCFLVEHRHRLLLHYHQSPS